MTQPPVILLQNGSDVGFLQVWGMFDPKQSYGQFAGCTWLVWEFATQIPELMFCHPGYPRSS